MRRSGLCVLSLISLVVASICSTMARGPARADDKPAAGRKLAFLVGVKDYEHPELHKLDFPENDVDDLARVLTAQGFDVTVMTTVRGRANADLKPTAANIRDHLLKLLKSAAKEDLIVVGLSGHGLQPVEYKDSFFCPADAVPLVAKGKLTDPDSLISIQETLSTLRRSKVGLKLLLVDACRNDPSIKGSKGVDDVSIDALPPQTGILLSCSPGEFSFEHKSLGSGHGAFFYYVTEGLRGEAKDANGKVTWENLRGFVRTHVPDKVQELYGKDGGEQNPNEIGNLRGRPAVLARIEPARIENPPDKSEKPRMARKENPPSDNDVPSSKLLSNSIGMKLALIPAGEFQMGAVDGEEKAESDEKPQHRVRITKPFYLGVYEVTQGEFARVMGRNPSWFSARGGGKESVSGRDTSRFPVETVSWYDAAEFCNKLSDKENRQPYYRLANVERNEDRSIKAAEVSVESGNGYRLPTEAEWEYACRAGTTTPFYIGTALNGSEANSDGNYPYGTTEKGPSLNRTTTVGSYNKPNAFGLHDMHGNVWEWCWDVYDKEYYGKTPEADPSGPAAGSFRVIRGGGWNGSAVDCRCASRHYDEPASGLRFEIGFRVVRPR